MKSQSYHMPTSEYLSSSDI